jgi:hypothetical protein
MKRVGLLALFAVFLSSFAASSARAQGAPHLEGCVLTHRWDYEGGTLGIKNICDIAIAIQFMRQKDPQAKRADVKPGERFDSGLSQAEIGSEWWIFTACPVGYVSSVRFETENRYMLTAGEYNCQKK